MCLSGRKLQYLLAFFLFIALLAYGRYNASKGIDLTDEGLYLSTALRFALGDLPFRDEVVSFYSQFSYISSLIFRLWPDMSLLQVRTLGIAFHALALFAFFLIVSRYTSPLYSALACASMFFWNNFYRIFSPSYNSISSDLSLASLSAVLFAVSSGSKFHSALLSAFGGFLLGLAVLSHPGQILLLGMVFFAAGGAIHDRAFRFLIASCVLTVAGFCVWVAFMGLVPDIWGLTKEEAAGYAGRKFRIYALRQEFWQAVPASLLMLLPFALSMRLLRGKSAAAVFCGISTTVVVVIFFLTALEVPLPLLLGRALKHTGLPRPDVLVFSFALWLSLFVLLFGRKNTDIDSGWRRLRNVSIAWGLLSSFGYGLFSDMALRACVHGMTPLFVIGMIELYRNADGSGEGGGLRKSVLAAAAVAFLVAGINYNHRYVYRDEEITRLTAEFTHSKLRGVHSTPEKVDAMAELLAYLGPRLKPGDDFLAYKNIPMLYYLTHTKPAYADAWASDESVWSKRDLLNKMLMRGKIPDYCVRMMANPRREAWSSALTYDERSPLNSFVESNYYVEKIVYPFEVLRRGQGQRYRLLDGVRPAFSDSFANWSGRRDTVDAAGLQRTSAPLMIHGLRGDFNFTRINEGGKNIIRVTPLKRDAAAGFVLQFGYWSGRNGFDLNINPGQKVVLKVTARKSGKPAQIYIQDRADTWERNPVAIYKTSWEDYVVSKKIREGATDVLLGVYWEPDTEKEWVEIKDIRIYVGDVL